MPTVLQFRRGTTVPSSGMNAGEPLFKTNDARFYIATGASTANWVGAPILDEDNMASDSAFKLATQQSIKAYVDAQVATHDALSELVDTNISNPQSGQVAVYDGTNSWDNVSISGDATMNAAGAVTIANNAITNAKMADDAVDSAEIAAGAIDTAHIANSQVTNAKLANSTTTFAGDSGSNQAMALGATFTIEGTSNEIETTMGTNKVTVNSSFVLSAAKGMSDQRIPNMRGIMSARTKPLQVVESSGDGAITNVVKFSLPPAKGDCVMVDADNPAELVRLLREEAKII